MAMNLLPFNELKDCPACGISLTNSNVNVEYSDGESIPVSDGRFVDIRTAGYTPTPHLRKRCRCGYGWLEHTKDHNTQEPRAMLLALIERILASRTWSVDRQRGTETTVKGTWFERRPTDAETITIKINGGAVDY